MEWHELPKYNGIQVSQLKIESIRNAIKTCFHFHMLGNTMCIESRQENDMPQMFL